MNIQKERGGGRIMCTLRTVIVVLWIVLDTDDKSWVFMVVCYEDLILNHSAMKVLKCVNKEHLIKEHCVNAPSLSFLSLCSISSVTPYINPSGNMELCMMHSL